MIWDLDRQLASRRVDQHIEQRDEDGFMGIGERKKRQHSQHGCMRVWFNGYTPTPKTQEGSGGSAAAASAFWPAAQYSSTETAAVCSM